MRKRTVAGESIELLRSALGKLQHRTASDGMVELTGRLEPELGEPLSRAVLRIEKELLLGMSPGASQNGALPSKGGPTLSFFSRNASRPRSGNPEWRRAASPGGQSRG